MGLEEKRSRGEERMEEKRSRGKGRREEKRSRGEERMEEKRSRGEERMEEKLYDWFDAHRDFGEGLVGRGGVDVVVEGVVVGRRGGHTEHTGCWCHIPLHHNSLATLALLTTTTLALVITTHTSNRCHHITVLLITHWSSHTHALSLHHHTERYAALTAATQALRPSPRPHPAAH
ncbi:hypothetical protein Pmani_012556 [Petrolisthes manimaculis]|uniref:Uncharacterized protein n=1 Tax=Petrolisthes manimaculis TaxID=1843537 RepID=A0AAE1PYT8_9EUCA|nr:hypothetical protein Pmani_012556 [Petrolisthes manimaculis]